MFLQSFLSIFVLSALVGDGNCCTLVGGSSNISCFELKSEPYITRESSYYGNAIEGTAVNPNGDIFAVNIGLPPNNHRFGRVYPSQTLFYEDLNPTALLNGIRFLNESIVYVVDAVNHRVLELHLNPDGNLTSEWVNHSTIFCASEQMLQPNDLTLSIKTGAVFTSGMQWLSDTNETHGDIWACLQDGHSVRLEVMGRTNGIDLSPDESILYVSESYNRAGVPYIQRIWKYDVDVTKGTISGKTLFVDFAEVDSSSEVDIDGMKTDDSGNLFVTRHGSSQVVIFSPAGTLIGRIHLNFPNPTNLEFGGPDGTLLFIVGKCKDNEQLGCVDSIEMANPGRSWKLLTSGSTPLLLGNFGITWKFFVSCLIFMYFRPGSLEVF